MSIRQLAAVALLALIASGCVYHIPNRDTDRCSDSFFHDRHRDCQVNYHCDPLMQAAREMTNIEDDLRRDGTITVKSPDVWGDGNLMYFLQEFDSQLATTTTKFAESVQAYIARSDTLDVQGTSALGVALNNTSSSTPPTPPEPVAAPLPSLNPFDVVKFATAAVPVSSTMGSGVAIEPTEAARQQATYIDVCQALRRRHMGDDNSRAAGYGLYKFRVPVSILPGRETHQGYSAVVTLRATTVVDESELRYTYPKLVIADLVDTLTPVIISNWTAPTPNSAAAIENLSYVLRSLSTDKGISDQNIKAKLETSSGKLDDIVRRGRLNIISPSEMGARAQAVAGDLGEQIRKAAKARTLDDATANELRLAISRPKSEAQGQSEDILSVDVTNVYGLDAVFALRDILQNALKIQYNITGVPQAQDVRTFLFSYLAQAQTVMEQNNLFTGVPEAAILDFGNTIAQGKYGDLQTKRNGWDNLVGNLLGSKSEFVISTRLMAIQTGIMEINLKKILQQLQIEGKLTAEEAALIDEPMFHFFNVTGSTYKSQAISLWQMIVREEFPLHVFTLDPQVEEQNGYDAFSRQRQLQLALAYNVATGRFNTQQKLAMSRQLQLDQATIDLNRTVVGFSHGEDTFGWYFYPRIQSPPTEKSNIAAVARDLWSNGPTDHYDKKHRELEPGMRECEVLIAMPSFVNKVSFDVTTNWERLTVPGATKRSYETMLCQGERIQHLKSILQKAGNQGCYRPGDFERLLSRAEQLEAMLGMQTYLTNVPYSYEQSGTDLFDKGDVHLRPVVTGFYGVQYLDVPAATTASSTTSSATAGGGSASASSVTVNVNPAATPAATTTTTPSSSTPDTSAHVFITGKNFHPTLTYVVVGGAESTETASPMPGSAPNADVTVINRQLIEVKVNKLDAALSSKTGFELRVGTPAGLSNPVLIPPAPQASGASSGPAFVAPLSYSGTIGQDKSVSLTTTAPSITIDLSTQPEVTTAGASICLQISGTLNNGTPVTFTSPGPQQAQPTSVPTFTTQAFFYPITSTPVMAPPNKGKLTSVSLTIGDLQNALNQALQAMPYDSSQPIDLTISGLINLSSPTAPWPTQKTSNTLTIHLTPPSKSGSQGSSSGGPSLDRIGQQAGPPDPPSFQPIPVSGTQLVMVRSRPQSDQLAYPQSDFARQSTIVIRTSDSEPIAPHP